MTWLPVETCIPCPSCHADQWEACHGPHSCRRRVDRYIDLQAWRNARGADKRATISDDHTQTGGRDERRRDRPSPS